MELAEVLNGLKKFVGIPTEPTPFDLYQAGDIKGARKAYKEQVNESKSKSKKRQWAAHMGLGWVEDEVGNHWAAIDSLNAALEIANEIGDDIRTGRTLSFLGWAYSSMGLYEAAIEFYEEAIKLGTTESGRIKAIALWGLSKQELGAIYFKLGDTKKAKEYIFETYTFAASNGIDVGIAEGGAHLAEIFLVEGNLGEASRYAKEAIKAANRCGCSPNNTARAYVMLAKTVWEQSKHDFKLQKKAEGLMNDSLNFAMRIGNKRSIAETKLLISTRYDQEEIDKKYKLVAEAFEILANMESERRGDAEAELGQVFIEKNETKLAEFYLKNGYKINEKLLRKQANAYVVAKLADLAFLNKDIQKEIEELERAVNLARETGASKLVFEKSYELSQAYAEQGYLRLALDWGEVAQKEFKEMLTHETNSTVSASLRNKEVELLEYLSEVHVGLSRDEWQTNPEEF